jgi:hypothetical protein
VNGFVRWARFNLATCGGADGNCATTIGKRHDEGHFEGGKKPGGVAGN